MSSERRRKKAQLNARQNAPLLHVAYQHVPEGQLEAFNALLIGAMMCEVTPATFEKMLEFILAMPRFKKGKVEIVQ